MIWHRTNLLTRKKGSKTIKKAISLKMILPYSQVTIKNTLETIQIYYKIRYYTETVEELVPCNE